MKRFALSIDLDPLRCYYQLYGLAGESGKLDPVLTTAVPRLCDLAERLRVRGTIFAVGDSLGRPEHAGALGAAVAAGHELACHSFSHPYDLSRLAAGRADEEIVRGLEACERISGTRPSGFRAPGYLLGPVLLGRLERLGLGYDSSMLPSPLYQAAKAAARLGLWAAGRESAAVLGDPREAFGPGRPYRPDPVRPWRRGAATLWELPLSRVAGLPLTGGLLALAGAKAASALGRLAARADWVQLELHGVDLLDIATDGLDPALGVQPDLRIRWQTKARAIEAFVARLLRSHQAIRLDQAPGI